MTSTEEYQQLVADVRKWEEDATPTSSNKIKAIYGKLHDGVALRLIAPFLFYIILNKMRKMMNPSEDELFE